ncbi:unnamed protein product, partial [Strongylus vulgaris]
SNYFAHASHCVSPSETTVLSNVEYDERIRFILIAFSLMLDPKDTPPKPIIETRAEKKERRRREKEELLAYKVEQGIAQWNPAENPNATEDPYKTLFVARINYETSENRLKREFETYGKIKKLAMIHDLNGKPRGYAFIEYSDKSEMSINARTWLSLLWFSLIIAVFLQHFARCSYSALLRWFLVERIGLFETKFI